MHDSKQFVEDIESKIKELDKRKIEIEKEITSLYRSLTPEKTIQIVHVMINGKIPEWRICYYYNRLELEWGAPALIAALEIMEHEDEIINYAITLPGVREFERVFGYDNIESANKLLEYIQSFVLAKKLSR